eukprot:RCo050484
MPLLTRTWRVAAGAAALAIGSGLGLALLQRRPADPVLHAKAQPKGKPLQNVVVKGYACHPRANVITTILTFFDVPYEFKEYNTLNREVVYRSVPNVLFQHAEFDWVEAHGPEESLSHLAQLMLGRPPTAVELQWAGYVQERLVPAMEYRMWNSWSSTLEQLEYFPKIVSISEFRRTVHPYLAALWLPFQKCRQLRKKNAVNNQSLAKQIQDL